jgi:transcription antitermination factor NusG
MLTEQHVQPHRWYAVHTRSRHEKIVRDELLNKEIETYLPVFHEWHAWKDRTKRIEQPIFPGYVFARFCDRSEARLRVVQTRGAVRILGNGNSIESVPDAEIDAVRRMLIASQSCIPHPFLREGAWVRVQRGPLTGLEGLLVEFKNRGRLVLSVNLLSQSVATEVDLSDVGWVSRQEQECTSAQARCSYAAHQAMN